MSTDESVGVCIQPTKKLSEGQCEKFNITPAAWGLRLSLGGVRSSLAEQGYGHRTVRGHNKTDNSSSSNNIRHR